MDIVNITNIGLSETVLANIVNIENIVDITISDNVPVNIDGVLFLHITDTFKASYEVQLSTSIPLSSLSSSSSSSPPP